MISAILFYFFFKCRLLSTAVYVLKNSLTVNIFPQRDSMYKYFCSPSRSTAQAEC